MIDGGGNGGGGDGRPIAAAALAAAAAAAASGRSGGGEGGGPAAMAAAAMAAAMAPAMAVAISVDHRESRESNITEGNRADSLVAPQLRVHCTRSCGAMQSWAQLDFHGFAGHPSTCSTNAGESHNRQWTCSQCLTAR